MNIYLSLEDVLGVEMIKAILVPSLWKLEVISYL